MFYVQVQKNSQQSLTFPISGVSLVRQALSHVGRRAQVETRNGETGQRFHRRRVFSAIHFQPGRVGRIESHRIPTEDPASRRHVAKSASGLGQRSRLGVLASVLWSRLFRQRICDIYRHQVANVIFKSESKTVKHTYHTFQSATTNLFSFSLSKTWNVLLYIRISDNFCLRNTLFTYWVFSWSMYQSFTLEQIICYCTINMFSPGKR